MEFWVLAGPLFGILVGGIVAGGFNIYVSQRNHANWRSRDLAELRREEYFAALDSTDAVRRAFRTYASSNSGRWQPEDSDLSPEADEMRRRDTKSADALDALIETVADFERTELHVQAVGSDAVKSLMERLRSLIEDFFVQSRSDGFYRGATAMKFLANFQNVRNDLVSTMRSDLEVDRVYSPKLPTRRIRRGGS